MATGLQCIVCFVPRYFSGSEGYVKHQYTFWHGQHAEFFEGSEDYDRKSEVRLLIKFHSFRFLLSVSFSLCCVAPLIL